MIELKEQQRKELIATCEGALKTKNTVFISHGLFSLDPDVERVKNQALAVLRTEEVNQIISFYKKESLKRIKS